MARAANIELTIDDFRMVCPVLPCSRVSCSRSVPADCGPHARPRQLQAIWPVHDGGALLAVPLASPKLSKNSQDLHNIGGIPAVVKFLLKETDLLDGSTMTVTGQTLAENVADGSFRFPLDHLPGDDPNSLAAPDLDFSKQSIIMPLSSPIKSTGHICILRGSLAPNSAVAKITGKEGLSFSGPAVVFDAEQPFYVALEKGQVKEGMVVVLRYLGPKGGPGRVLLCFASPRLMLTQESCRIECPKRLVPPLRSWARDSEAKSRSSATGASPARVEASSSATSRRRVRGTLLILTE